MERNQGRLIEQLQSVQIRQRKVIQQLQVENARRLSDLADVRQERDAFRKEAARVRKENAELHSRLEQIWTEHQDLKRERATLVRLATAGHAHSRTPNMGLKIMNTLSVLNEEHTESSEKGETIINADKARGPEMEPYLLRALPDPPKFGSQLPRRECPVSEAVISSRNGSRVRPTIETTLLGGQSATL